MLDLYYKYPRVIERLRSGALGSVMDRIAEHFEVLGYKASSVKIFFGHLSRFSRFAAKFCDDSTSAIAEDVVDRATHLVSEGRPINEVADLLGHRNIDTTAIYIKVALPQLATVALPFPGGAA